jgi:hypothetical protein
LPLAARELGWPPPLEPAEIEPRDDVGDPRVADGARPVAQPEADVLGNCQVREQRVALEDIADATLLRRQIHTGRSIEQHTVVHDDASGVGMNQARQALERERLAGARRPEQHGDAVARGPRDV